MWVSVKTHLMQIFCPCPLSIVCPKRNTVVLDQTFANMSSLVCWVHWIHTTQCSAFWQECHRSKLYFKVTCITSYLRQDSHLTGNETKLVTYVFLWPIFLFCIKSLINQLSPSLTLGNNIYWLPNEKFLLLSSSSHWTPSSWTTL